MRKSYYITDEIELENFLYDIPKYRLQEIHDCLPKGRDCTKFLREYVEDIFHVTVDPDFAVSYLNEYNGEFGTACLEDDSLAIGLLFVSYDRALNDFTNNHRILIL